MQKACSVIILAAGFSSRMGKPKWILELKNGHSFLENLLMQYALFQCKDIVVVFSKKGLQTLKDSGLEKKYSFKAVLNNHPEKERFYSIQCGLKELTENHFIFIQNADNPFADLDILHDLYNKRKKADYIKPIINEKGGHPILISRKIKDEILKMTDTQMAFNSFLKKFECAEVKVENESIFTNINSESDYLRLLREVKHINKLK